MHLPGGGTLGGSTSWCIPTRHAPASGSKYRMFNRRWPFPGLRTAPGRLRGLGGSRLQRGARRLPPTRRDRGSPRRTRQEAQPVSPARIPASQDVAVVRGQTGGSGRTRPGRLGSGEPGARAAAGGGGRGRQRLPQGWLRGPEPWGRGAGRPCARTQVGDCRPAQGAATGIGRGSPSPWPRTSRGEECGECRGRGFGKQGSSIGGHEHLLEGGSPGTSRAEGLGGLGGREGGFAVTVRTQNGSRVFWGPSAGTPCAQGPGHLRGGQVPTWEDTRPLETTPTLPAPPAASETLPEPRRDEQPRVSRTHSRCPRVGHQVPSRP